MTSVERGALLGELAVQLAAKDYPKLHETVKKDKLSTHINCLLLYTWAGQIVLERIGVSDVREAILWHVGRVMMELSKLGCARDRLKPFVESRLEAFDAATTAGEGQPMWNVAKYFIACCDHGWRIIPYDSIIPNPDDLNEMNKAFPGMVNEPAVRQYHELRTKHNVPCYNLDPAQNATVVAFLTDAGQRMGGMLAEL